MKQVNTTLRHLAQHIAAARIFYGRLNHQEIQMKHTRTLLASSIVAAFVGASGLSFAQSAMLTDPLARDANGNPNAWTQSEAQVANLTQPTTTWTDASQLASATAQSRVDGATGPEAVPAAQVESSNQLASAADRVQAETGQLEAVPYDAYSVAVAEAQPVVTSAEPQVAVGPTAGLTQDSSPLAPYDSTNESRVAMATAPDNSSSTMPADDVFLSEYAKAEPGTEAAPATEAAVTPTDQPAATTETAAPVVTSAPLTEDEVLKRSQPPVYSTPIDDEEID